ncbi:MAG: hypothetical protein ABIE07_11910, partial [Candidatus Zixiibacteriota bacterium]
IWLHLLMIASSNSFALIITLQGNVWTFEPQLSYLEINCCTSNVNPPPADYWNGTCMEIKNTLFSNVDTQRIQNYHSAIANI